MPRVAHCGSSSLQSRPPWSLNGFYHGLSYARLSDITVSQKIVAFYLFDLLVSIHPPRPQNNHSRSPSQTTLCSAQTRTPSCQTRPTAFRSRISGGLSPGGMDWGHDWRAHERELNTLPVFTHTTAVDSFGELSVHQRGAVPAPVRPRLYAISVSATPPARTSLSRTWPRWFHRGYKPYTPPWRKVLLNTHRSTLFTPSLLNGGVYSYL